MMPELGDATGCGLVFVYGLLRRGCALHHVLKRLGAKYQAEAKVAGELFELGRYTGARPVASAERWVRGELFQLPQPAHDLKVLDGVEGYNPRAAERSEFIRAVADITLGDGTTCRAWIYWLGAKVPTLRRITPGITPRRRRMEG
jgi:gamma-glutamylcyclotransferase (GGCT)/AIG2-like uncharacterized protein YtfP